MHDEKVYDVPLRNIAFVLYHAAKQHIDDKLLYKRFEEVYPSLRSTKIQSREAYGGLWGCYTSGLASDYGRKFWEGQIEKLAYGLSAREIWDLVEAHNLNKTLDPLNLKDQIDRLYKKRLLEVWDSQVLYNQRVMMTLITEFLKVKYYDEELLKKLVWSINSKNRIQNLEFFSKFHNAFHEINDNPKTTLYKKLDKDIQDFENKFSTRDFKWRYSIKDKRIRPHKELVARREDAKWESFTMSLTTDERSERERQRIDKEQQLKNAVHNEELFIQVVQKMMNEGKTTIEMMVYLDVREEDIINAQSIISKNEQIKKLEELRKSNQLPFQKEKPEHKLELKKATTGGGAAKGDAKDQKKDDKKVDKKKDDKAAKKK